MKISTIQRLAGLLFVTAVLALSIMARGAVGQVFASQATMPSRGAIVACVDRDASITAATSLAPRPAAAPERRSAASAAARAASA